MLNMRMVVLAVSAALVALCVAQDSSADQRSRSKKKVASACDKCPQTADCKDKSKCAASKCDKAASGDCLLTKYDKDKDGRLSENEKSAARKSWSHRSHKGRPGDKSRWEGMKERVLAKYDADKDGKLDDQEKAKIKKDWSERAAAMKKEFMKKYDTNKDGKLCDKEKAAVRTDMEKRRAEWMKGAADRMVAYVLKNQDKNNDGKLNVDEVKNKESFGDVDTNNDGYLDKAEIKKAMEARFEKMKAEMKKRREAWAKKRADVRRPEAKRPSVEDVVKRIMSGDANNDGKLNADECSPRLRGAFGKIDANNDGYITKEELVFHMKKSST